MGRAWDLVRVIELSGAAGEAGDGGDEFVGVDGFGDVDLVSGQDGAGAVFGSCEGGEGEGGDFSALVGGEFSDGADEFVAVHVGHAEIADEDVGAGVFHHFECDAGGFGGEDGGMTVFEQSDDYFAGILFIVDDEDGDAAEGDGFMHCEGIGGGKIGSAGCFAGAFVGGEWEFDDESGSESFAGAFGLDGTAVEFDEVFDNGEADAEAAIFACDGGIGLSEAFEDVGEEFGFHSAAGVGDGDFDGGVGSFEEDFDLAADGGEFDGVVEKVPDDLLKAVGVAGELGGARVEDLGEGYFPGVGGGLDGFDGGVDDGDQIEGLDVDADFSGGDTSHVEEVFDELGLGFGVSFNDGEAFLEGFGVAA